MLVDQDYLTAAYLGDQEHKRDLLLIFGVPSNPHFLSLISAVEQARYLRSEAPELVPPKNPNGTAPNDHTVSTAFERQYHVSPAFQFKYFTYIRRRF